MHIKSEFEQLEKYEYAIKGASLSHDNGLLWSVFANEFCCVMWCMLSTAHIPLAYAAILQSGSLPAL